MRASGRLGRLALPLAIAGGCVLFGLSVGRGVGQSTPPPVTALPQLGTADSEMRLMGAARSGPQLGETWGYRLLPANVPPPVTGGERLVFAPAPSGRTSPQLAFLRHTDATGWYVAATPRDAQGNAYRGPTPNPSAATVTAQGGALLVGRDGGRPALDQLVVLIHDAGGIWGEVRPPAGRLPADPAAVLAEGEALGSDGGAGRVTTGAYDASGGRTAVFFGVTGAAVESNIVHYTGTQWQREPIAHPAGVTSARIIAIDATSAANAWALVESDGARGVELYRRVTAGTATGAEWRPQTLGRPLFDDRDTPAQGVTEAGPLRDNSDPLTVTTDGLWIDASLRVATADPAADPPRLDATLYFRPSGTGGSVEGTWCDASSAIGTPLCDHPLDAGFGRGPGYRSFAFAGPGLGTRIVTNPTQPGAGEVSNRGTYLRFAGDRFERMPGAGASGVSSGAFSSADRGWLEGPVQIAAGAPPQVLRRWPVALRAPLADAVGAPGTTPGAPGSQALAVGADGAVARFAADQGWVREFLLSGSGAVSRPRLRGVAWPESGRAHAVGDLGAMWQWRADTDLWERDPAAPVGFEGQLLDVAFQHDDPQRGYAVGRAGALLRYDKTWTQEALPAGFEARDITSIAFAGSQALAVAGADLLVNDGGGWRVDDGVRALLDEIRSGGPYLRVAAGLPDGGAVVGGRGFVLERDGAGAPWRFADQPLPAQTVVAAAALRAGDRVRALVAVQARLDYPQLDDPIALDPNVPPPVLPAQPMASDGYLLSETESGWRDEQRTAYAATTTDRPLKSDPIAALLVAPGGGGWAIGGWSGEPDYAGRGTPLALDRARVQTAAIFRYDPAGNPAAPPELQAAQVPLPAGAARFAVGGHAQCEQPCADLASQSIAPDRMLTGALTRARDMAARPSGPRFFLNTGGRTRPRPPAAQTAAEARRYADLLGSAPGLAVFSAVSEGDARSGVGAFRTALGGQPAPGGAAPAPPGIAAGAIPGAAAGPGARTHYAFDSAGPEGMLRVIVIDNALGSLAASDPHQNPPEPQLPWLREALADAKRRSIPAIVLGSRDLSRFTPRLNAAGDGDLVARALVEGGASAYFFDRPEENRAIRIPSGAATTIPAFGTGTLGYRSPLRVAAGQDVALSLFGDGEILLAEVDLAKRDVATNVAPVSVRGLPIIDDLSLQAIDGTLLRRSRPALFQGLGRRPAAGDRWGDPAGDSGPDPPGGDPYTLFPSEPCLLPGCETRLTPEFEFASSDTDIADFVRQDPESTNLRKPFIGPGDKVVTDARSALLCPFNAGTTTVTVRSGGLSFSQKVTVLAGSVQRPCGTRPLNPARFQPVATAQGTVQVPTPAPQPEGQPEPPPNIPLPAVTPIASISTKAPTVRLPPPPPLDGLPPGVPVTQLGLPVFSPPPASPGFGQPIPPSGATVRILEEKREEEVAPEQSQAFSRVRAGSGGHMPLGELTIGAVLLLALAGAAAVGPRRRDRRMQLAIVAAEHEHGGARRHPSGFDEPTGRRQR